MVEARGEVLDLILANLDLDEDIELLSGLFIDEENHELVLQKDGIFCLDEEVMESKKCLQLYLLMGITFRERTKKLKCPFLTDWAQKDCDPQHLINIFVQSSIQFINE